MECTGIARKTAGLCDILLFVTAMAASFGYVVSGRRAREMPADRVVCWGEKVTDKTITLAVMAIAARRACLETDAGKAGILPAFPVLSQINYCAGAGAGSAGAGSAGFVASGAGCIGCSAAGGLVLCVVVASPPVPLSLQAATPSRASAENDARMSFFMVSLL